jgi:lysophospholipid acyltransferase (LPLAT)-like uncharacterized protein
LKTLQAINPPRKLVVPHRPKWHGEIAAWLIYALGSTVAGTWRFHWDEQTGHFLQTQGGPVIFSLWHNRHALSMALWNKFRQSPRKAVGLAALVSASKDGALLARILEHFHVAAARGSSSRRGAQALLELTSYIEEGYHVAITPDGPRGPKYQVQDGILSLSQLTGAQIIPVGMRIQHKYCLKSWDAFQVPLPFTQCNILVGQPISIPRNASPEQRAQTGELLREEMIRLNKD